MTTAFYHSRVMHQRLRPRRHRLAYRIFSLLIDLDTMQADAGKTRLFSIDRFNLFSFHQKDRGDGRATGLKSYVLERLAQAGLREDGMRVCLLTMPRVLGFAFNPLSVYFCHRADGTLAAVLWEVDNTFGERNAYLIPVRRNEGDLLTQTCNKDFYVSPFMQMALTYRFRFRVPGDALSLHITASDGEGPLLFATQNGIRAPLSDRVLLTAFLAMPLQAAYVLGGIHWEALRIWLKGVALVAKPAKPARTVTIVNSKAANT